ncbi:MAG TPA: hypothetical protein PK074_03910 [Spirochaetales bacterium]|nr:hypothetical protein [Spirochaetales bacterium]HQK33843.1 hypothetical protein [Spirochaetales bacterium]
MENNVEHTEDEISLLDIVVVLLKHWKILLIVPLVVAIVVMGYFWYSNNQLINTSSAHTTIESYITINFDPLIGPINSIVNIQNLIANVYAKDINLLVSALKNCNVQKIGTITVPETIEEMRFVVQRLFLDGKDLSDTNLADDKKPYTVSVSNDVITIKTRYLTEEQSKQFLTYLVEYFNDQVLEKLSPIAQKEIEEYTKLQESARGTSSPIIQNNLLSKYPVYTSALYFMEHKENVLRASDIAFITRPIAKKSAGKMGVIAYFAALFFVIFLAFVLEAIENVKKDSESMEKIRAALHKNKRQ